MNGIIVLGGVVGARVTVTRGTAAVSGSVERLMGFADLAQRYPNARLVFTGGSGSLLYQEFKEGEIIAPILKKLGMNTLKITYEAQSRNTYESAVNSLELINPQSDEVWILVTSAAHMPRAVGVFRAVEWPNVIPYPVDYNTVGNHSFSPPLDLRRGLGGMKRAITEFTGLLAYYLTGRSDALIPAP